MTTTLQDRQVVEQVVKEVLGRITGSGVSHATGGGYGGIAPQPAAASAAGPSIASGGASDGLFGDVDEAVAAATRAQQQLMRAGMVVRGQICDLYKKMAVDNAEVWGRFELDETKVGRLDHKIGKLQGIPAVPGVEYLQTAAHSGDAGIGLDEAAPWGVLGVVTPVTHSIPTLTANAIAMIASGNAMVVNAHPSGAKSAAMAAAAYNRAVKTSFGIDPLICVINPPTLRSAEQIFSHPDLPLLVVTGGPAVARAAMKQAKRAIVAGPGNPPVIVDETADLDLAAKSIIAGASFDNNLLCIGEKEVFVVDAVFDRMMEAMSRAGAMRLDAAAIDRLTQAAFSWKDDHHAVNKDLVGKDVSVLAQAAGVSSPAGCDLLFGQTEESSPFVSEEQMMPFVPFVRVRDFEEALSLAVKHEHGFGHTAIIHSNNLQNITRLGQAMNVTLYAVNGSCLATLGNGGEGYPSYSIATPSGEGVTNPMTFTRFRRVAYAGALRIV